MTTPNNPEHQNQNASAHTTTPSDSTDAPATDAPAGQAAGDGEASVVRWTG